MLYRVTLNYACFGVKTDKDIDIVTEVAPIWKFAKGWKLEMLKEYVAQRKGKIEKLKEC